MLLKDKVVIVTGSTAGIGAGIARRCIAEGAKVMVHGRDEKRAQALVEELGSQAAYVIADLTDLKHDTLKTVEKIVDATVDQFGRLDILVNNAGISPRNTIDDLNEELFYHTVHTNMKAPLFLTQQAVKLFRKQGGGGVILNIGSINAYCGERVLLVYSMTKGALMTMTRNLGDALGSENIRINQLNVGWTLTEKEMAIKEKTYGFKGDWEAKIPHEFAPRGKILRPEEIANHVVFWVSDLSKPVNGQVYEVEQYPLIGRNHIDLIDLE